MVSISNTLKEKNWNQLIRTLPGMSILQTKNWADFKGKYGWKSEFRIWEGPGGKPEAAAAFLIRTIHLPVFNVPICTIYIPQGPLLDWKNIRLRNTVLDDIQKFAEEKKAINIKIDPEVILSFHEAIDANDKDYQNAEILQNDLIKRGWRFSSQQIQFKNTAWINLEQSEEELLAGMKQKTRYNVRLANRKGVQVRKIQANELEKLYEMYLKTSMRDGFIIRPKEYYLDLWESFIEADKASAFIAEVERQAVAGLVLFHFGHRSWYMYGMSIEHHREKMPSYLLQWEAIKYSKEIGCTLYDLWGAPDTISPNDPMWGVYRFKQGLGCKFIHRIGAFDYTTNVIQYKIILWVLNAMQRITRLFRFAQEKQKIK